MLKQLSFSLIRCPIQKQSVRYRYRLRGKKPHEAKSLEQYLEERNYVDPEIAQNIDIGFALGKKSRKEEMDKLTYINKLKSDAQLEKAARNMTLNIPLEDVKKMWLTSDGPKHIKLAAEHYGVFKDLFGYAFFTPIVSLDIVYRQVDGKLAPVHRGNVVKPAESINEPIVTFESNPDDLWTLMLTNPDGNVVERRKECIHWLIGNIPGSDVKKGEQVIDYLQPFPPLGTGFQRMIFVLYKQNKRIDYSQLKKETPCRELSERTFETLEFYRQRQDDMTPAGLAFYQTDWDDSVRQTFHKDLNMEQPNYEYDFVKPYRAPQKWFPRRAPFNMYLDKYRDPRDIAKDHLVRKLKTLNPFEKPKKPFPYPNVHKFDAKETPSWLITEEKRIRLGLGRINLNHEQLDDHTSK